MGGDYLGSKYGGNYTVWPVENVAKNAFYPISAIHGDSEYQDILKRRWQEGRKGAFSTTSINQKLEAYRDLFLKSGAWQRMIDRFGVTSTGPMLVADLAKEIDLIERWYENRFREMDAYFGISDDIQDMTADEQNNSVYNLSGTVTSSHTKGIIIKNHQKYFVK